MWKATLSQQCINPQIQRVCPYSLLSWLYSGLVGINQNILYTAKVRRLYDIANVLTTLGLIKKKTFLAPYHRKMPGYAWAGPSIQEIQAIRKLFYVTQNITCIMDIYHTSREH